MTDAPTIETTDEIPWVKAYEGFLEDTLGQPLGDFQDIAFKAGYEAALSVLRDTEFALGSALLVLQMVDTNNRVLSGEKGLKAWEGRFVKTRVREVLDLFKDSIPL